MKLVSISVLEACAFLALLGSCSDRTPDSTATDGGDIPDGHPVIPCEFELDSIHADSTFTIDCFWDLEGQTVDLPSNVTIAHESGGDIVNGTLTFVGSSRISGVLLNSTLFLEETIPELIDPVFNFIPARWNITEGIVSDEIALQNRDTLRSTINLTKSMGASTFKIAAMDAYFKVHGYNDYGDFVSGLHGFAIPSDFTLSMTDDTFLRVQPNELTGYNLILFTDGVSNSKIIGGNLIGDRDEHTYVGSDTHEFGTLIEVNGASNLLIENVTIKMATGDGLTISEKGHAFEPDRIRSSTITVRGCVFDLNRRNNLSVTGGYDILIEDNQILNAGQATSLSNGTYPKFGIDIEAYRGDGIVYEEAYDITIRGNTERNSYEGAVIVHTGDDVVIENNNVETTIAYSVATGIEVRNNTITSQNRDSNGSAVGIAGGGFFQSSNNVISGNTIVGFGNAIVVTDSDVEVVGNTVRDFGQGITLKQLKNASVSQNEFYEPKENSSIAITGVDYIDDVEILNNVFNIGKAKPIDFYGINTNDNEQSYRFTIRDNTIDSEGGSQFQHSRGIVFHNNTLKGTLNFDDVSEARISQNNIRYADINDASDVLTIRGGSHDITVDENVIETLMDREDFNAIDIRGSERVTVSSNVLKQHGGTTAIKIENGTDFTVIDNRGDINTISYFLYFEGSNSTVTNNLTANGEERNHVDNN